MLRFNGLSFQGMHIFKLGRPSKSCSANTVLCYTLPEFNSQRGSLKDIFRRIHVIRALLSIVTLIVCLKNTSDNFHLSAIVRSLEKRPGQYPSKSLSFLFFPPQNKKTGNGCDGRMQRTPAVSLNFSKKYSLVSVRTLQAQYVLCVCTYTVEKM